MKPKAKYGAQRKREFDARKRAQGLKEYRVWVTPDERKLLVDTLTRHRLGDNRKCGPALKELRISVTDEESKMLRETLAKHRAERGQ